MGSVASASRTTALACAAGTASTACAASAETTLPRRARSAAATGARQTDGDALVGAHAAHQLAQVAVVDQPPLSMTMTRGHSATTSSM